MFVQILLMKKFCGTTVFFGGVFLKHSWINVVYIESTMILHSSIIGVPQQHPFKESQFTLVAFLVTQVFCAGEMNRKTASIFFEY